MVGGTPGNRSTTARRRPPAVQSVVPGGGRLIDWTESTTPAPTWRSVNVVRTSVVGQFGG